MINKRRFFWFSLILAGCLVATMMPSQGLEAGGPPQDVTFTDTKLFPPVVFSHKGHLDLGLKCGNCHSDIFKMKEGAANEGNALTMKAMKGGQFCGACHNGDKAFSVNGNCKKCHSGG